MFESTKLNLRRPVPSDIEIVQEAYVKPIVQIAEEAGILPDELELYIPHKAKTKVEKKCDLALETGKVLGLF